MPTPELPTTLVGLWVGVVGACVGSFLNVVVARLPAGESLVRPGSRCPRCRTPIRWYDNVPVVSWLALRARCRACGARISARYPAVELLGALAALGAWWRHGLSAAALAELGFTALLVALAAIDIDHWLLPHALTWPLIALGLIANGLHAGAAHGLASSAWGAGAGFTAFGLIYLVGEKVLHREAMGLGDVFLLAGIGAWLGVMALLPVVLLASIQGTVVGLALMAAGKGQPGPPAPPPEPPAEGPSAVEPDGQPVEPAPEGRPDTADPIGPQPTAPEQPGSEQPCLPQQVSGPAPSAPGAAEPDAAEQGAPEPEWIPPRHSVPFGPFLAAGALEWLYLSDLLGRVVPALKLFR